MYRPVGLASLGTGSSFKCPREIKGRRFIRIGDRTLILPHCGIFALSRYGDQTFSPSVVIGNNVYIGRHAYFTSINSILIGDGSVLSDYVYISDLSHGFDPGAGLIMKQPLQSKGPVVLGKNCFLGFGVSVMPGIALGEWCVVGANSVVTQSFPAFSMIAGAPARLLKTFCHEKKQWISVQVEAERGRS
jgi:acetyltransferase-like isoleucine patch superfamily enzyme